MEPRAPGRLLGIGASLLILEMTPQHSPDRECEVWFADRPFHARGYQKVTFKEARTQAIDFLFPPRPFDTLVSDLLLKEEELWGRLSKGKRSDLRIARNRGFTVTFGNSASDIERLYRGQDAFAAAKEIGAPPELAVLQRNSRHCLAAIMSDSTGNPVCWHMYVLDKPITRVWFGGSDLERAKSDRGYANTLLHWEGMLHFKEKGYGMYDWGGAVLDPESPVYSITRFKLSFGCEPLRTYEYWCHYPPSPFARVRRRAAWVLRRASHLPGKTRDSNS
jgi:hypothetical protein